MHDAVRTIGLLPPAEPSIWNYYKLVRICFGSLDLWISNSILRVPHVCSEGFARVIITYVCGDGLSLVGFVGSVTRMTMQVCEGTQLYQLLLGSVGQAKLSSMPQNRRSHSKKVLQEVLRVLSRNGITFSMLFY